MIPDDARWHHVALIKAEEFLVGYLDFEPVRTNAGRARTEPTSWRVAAARLQGRSWRELRSRENILDEVRLTARALDLGEMIQPGQPIFLDIPKRSATRGRHFVTILYDQSPGSCRECRCHLLELCHDHHRHHGGGRCPDRPRRPRTLRRNQGSPAHRRIAGRRKWGTSQELPGRFVGLVEESRARLKKG